MSSSNIQGGERIAPRPAGTDVDALGPSDSSDSGSDVQHERRMPTAPDNPAETGAVPSHPDSSSDAAGTGERATSVDENETDVDAPDIMPDHVGAATDIDHDHDEMDDLAADVDAEGDPAHEDDPLAAEAQRRG